MISYVKSDLISIGSITDSNGGAEDWYIGQPSSDNVILTQDEWYNLGKEGSGYTASYVREPIKGYVNIYVSGTSYLDQCFFHFICFKLYLIFCLCKYAADMYIFIRHCI